MKETKARKSKTLYILVFFSLLFSILLFSLTFIPMSTYFYRDLSIYDLAFHNDLYVNPVFSVSLITLLIGFAFTIISFFIVIFKNKSKKISIFLLCSSLPFLAFSFVVNIFTHPVISSANPYVFFFKIKHLSIVFQNLVLALSFIFNIVLIFYVAFKSSNVNLSIKKHKEIK